MCRPPNLRDDDDLASATRVCKPPNPRDGKDDRHAGYAFDDEPLQFGGGPGAAFIIVFSHFVLYYLYASLQLHDGALFVPVEFGRYATLLWEQAVPTAETCRVYASFIVFQTVLGFLLPGLTIQGTPVKSLAGKKLTYNCNGYGAWVITELVVAALHLSGTFRVQWVAEHYGALMTTMIVFGDLLALGVYGLGFVSRVPGEGHPGAFRKERMTGDHVYDFFMGASLNPRLAVRVSPRNPSQPNPQPPSPMPSPHASPCASLCLAQSPNADRTPTSPCLCNTHK